jgi:hypothetical protein
MKISRMPVYKDALALGANRKGAIMLDIGCCCAPKFRSSGFGVHSLYQLVTTLAKQRQTAFQPIKLLQLILSRVSRILLYIRRVTFNCVTEFWDLGACLSCRGPIGGLDNDKRQVINSSGAIHPPIQSLSCQGTYLMTTSSPQD